MKKWKLKFIVFAFFVFVFPFAGFFLIFIYNENILFPFITEVKVFPWEPEERVLTSEVLAAKRFINDALTFELKQNYTYYNYNNTVSNQLGAYRALPDTRPSTCTTRSHTFPARQHRVSVIIVFHNEGRAALLRTIMSLLRRTPLKYFHELILVDDYSDDAYLLGSLTQLLSQSSYMNNDKVILKVERNTQRLGVISSRNKAALIAKGDYLFFLDSHCEVNVGWLEPLLQRISTAPKRQTAVSPILDIIDPDSLEYRSSAKGLIGGFDWKLHFHWFIRPHVDEQNNADYYTTPTFAGGIFMITRDWFFKLNAFNTQLQIWGGDSLEFSLKLWLCGGQIEIVPCSRVGHIFRQQHSFQFPRDSNSQTTYLRNTKIIAEYWLDAYKYIYYALKPAAQSIDVQLLHEEFSQFRQKLQCHSFDWYLKHVFPELKFPNEKFSAYGTLSCNSRCLQTNQTDLLMDSCYTIGVTNWYLQRQTAQLQTAEGSCLSVRRNKHSENDLNIFYWRIRAPFIPILQYCEKSSNWQRWLRFGAQLMHESTKLCLDHQLGQVISLSRCRQTAPTQHFQFSLEMQKL